MKRVTSWFQERKPSHVPQVGMQGNEPEPQASFQSNVLSIKTIRSIVERIVEALDISEQGGPCNLATALQLLDEQLGLDASFVILSDRNDPSRGEFFASSSKKSTPIKGMFVPWGLLPLMFRDKNVIPWMDLRREPMTSPVWELVWQTMRLGPYAGPWSVSCLTLGSPAKSFALLALVAPSPVTHRWNEDLESALQVLACQIVSSLQWHRYRENYQQLSEHMNSSVFEKVSATADFLLLHSVFGAQQRQTLAIDEVEVGISRGNKRETLEDLRDVETELVNIRQAVRTFLDLSQREASSRADLWERPQRADWANIREVLRKLEIEYAPLASRSSKTFVLRVEEEARALPIISRALTSVLSNLIHNAIKYSHRGTKIKLDSTQAGQYLHLDVTSYGIPIRGNDRERIFLPGYRTEEASRLEFNAVGLGLPAARQLVEQAGGRLYLVASDPEDPSISTSPFRNVFRLRFKR